MSTVWYAQHFGQVFSVEDNEGWYQQVRQLLTVRAPLNVHYHFHQGSAYCNYSEAASQPFDFAMVDGSDRSGCMKFALAHVKKDSLVYLDNSDKHPGGGDTRGAEAQLLEAVRDRAGRCIYFTDFAPTDLFVNQGLLGAFGRYSGLV
jgi:predicted O-methyltransferase YrrM